MQLVAGLETLLYLNNQRESEYSKAFIGAITRSSNQLDTRIKGMIGAQNLKMKD